MSMVAMIFCWATSRSETVAPSALAMKAISRVVGAARAAGGASAAGFSAAGWQAARASALIRMTRRIMVLPNRMRVLLLEAREEVEHEGVHLLRLFLLDPVARSRH